MPSSLSVSVLLAGASPSPSPSTNAEPTKVASWFSKHGSLLVSHSIEIVLIIIVAAVARAVLVRMIQRFVERTADVAETRAGKLLEGRLLVVSERRQQRTRAIGSVLRSLTSAVMLAIALLMVISVLDIPTAPILASASVIGVAVGFGARNLVTDFVSGIFMILEDQYGVGDIIDAGDAKGTVEEIGLRVTRLRDSNGVVWYVRNGTISRIGNISQGWGHAVVDLPVAYDEDVNAVRELMTKVGIGLYNDKRWASRFLQDPPTVVGLESFDGEQLVMRVQAKTRPEETSSVSRELRNRLKAACDAAGVTVKGPIETASK